MYSKDLKGKSILYLTEPCFKNSYKDDKRLAAPLYSQVFDWARDEHNLYPEITLDSFKEPYELKVTIHHLDKSNSFVDTAYYPYSNGIPGMSNKLYNEAEKKAVRLLIKIINNK